MGRGMLFRYIIKFVMFTLVTGLVTGCTTIGGFEPAKEKIKDFTDASKASELYFLERNKAKLNSKRELDLIAMFGASTASGFNASSRARRLICDNLGILYDGTGELASIKLAARNFSAFNFDESDSLTKSIGNLGLNPAANLPELTGLGASSADKITSIVNKRIETCHSDFDFAKNFHETQGANASIISDATSVVESFNETVKPKAIAVINILVSYRQRKLLNGYIKENQNSLMELQSDLNAYAAKLDSGDLTEVRARKIMDYITSVEKFLEKASTSKKYNRIFTKPVIDLSTNVEAKNVIKAAEDYDSAFLAEGATPVRSLSKSVENLLKLIQPGNLQDHYNGITAAEEFIGALKELESSIDDPDLKAAISKL